MLSSKAKHAHKILPEDYNVYILALLETVPNQMCCITHLAIYIYIFKSTNMQAVKKMKLTSRA